MSRERERFDETGKKIKREIDVASLYNNNSSLNQIMGGRPRLGQPILGTTLNTITPCAACKLLRRRCAEECPFSPYFSPHEPQKFAAVHKVFGASNVSKLLMEVQEPQRADAANSLVYEANVRLRDPVYGCMGAISALQQQVQSLQVELNAVRAEILRYKYREAANNIINLASNNHATSLMSDNSGVATVSVAVLPPPSTPPAMPPPPPPPPPPSIVISSNINTNNDNNNNNSTSMYTATVMSTTGYSTIPRDNVSFFD